jgi:archaellum biogenesis ATPase FlaH
MPESNDYKKTIKYTEETDEKLQKLADQAGRTKREYFVQMVEYFYRTKKDPKDISDELLKNTLVKNHDTYIRFIRAQEEKILIPVKVEVDRMIQSQIKIIDFLNNQVVKANQDILRNQQIQLQQFSETDKVLKIIAEKLETKDSLKLKFLYILNNYNKARDSFSFTTSAKEKEDLLQQVRQQIAKL